MANPFGSAKPICQACNRPFNPSSPGATPTMGPTCAKRAGVRPGELAEWQLGFALPDLPPAPRPTPVAPRGPSRQIPRRFDDRYHDAKMAFDELFREFCRTGALKVGEAATTLDTELAQSDLEVFALADPTLTWLEPEHDLSLLIDHAGESIYHRRSINGVISLLEIDPSASPTAKLHVETIMAYVRDLRTLCEEHAAIQLPLFEY